jgi:hypothetical protein
MALLNSWALSTAVLVMLAFMSFMTTTFMVESMASANALLKWRKMQAIKRADSVSRDDPSDSDPQLPTQATSPNRIRTIQ